MYDYASIVWGLLYFFGTHEHMTTHHEGHRYGPRAKGRTWSHHLLAEERPEPMKNPICL